VIEVPATPTTGAKVMLVGTPVAEKLTTLVAPAVIAFAPFFTAVVAIDNEVVVEAAAASDIENEPSALVETLPVLSAPAGVEVPVAVTVAPESGLLY